MRPLPATVLLYCVSVFAAMPLIAGEPVNGWLRWRGPYQNGTGDETNLPSKISPEPGGENFLWAIDVKGQSTPVIADGKLFVMGFEGEGPDLQEGLVCIDAESGKVLWKHMYNDYMSDIIYLRYASSSPAIDPETGNVLMMGTQGFLACFTPDGKQLWSHSMMEEFGRLTFPNGRTQSPVIDGELVIVGAMTANWGAHGPGGHRFYAFDKKTGDLVYVSWPGERPKDSSFSTPHLGYYENQRVFWSGGGDGAIYCANARTGEPIWRYKCSHGGFNSSVLAYKDLVIGVHGAENLDESTIGRMVAIRPGAQKPAEGKPAELTKAHEAWRLPIPGTSTSPILVGNRIYHVSDMPAKLYCVDADAGKILWEKPLGTEERQSSPIFADGKLYIPLQEHDYYIIKPSDKEGEVLSHVKLDGTMQGSTAIYRGRIYQQTMKKLYCFGSKTPGPLPPAPKAEPKPTPGPLAKFLVSPADMLLKPGAKQPLKLIGVDANGNWLDQAFDAKAAKWEGYIPPTAKVKSSIKGAVADGTFVAQPEKTPSAGALKAELDGKIGITRGRVLPDLPLSQDFEKYELQKRDVEPGDMFAYPPLPWIGARLKWEVKELEGNKVLAKTTDDRFFQRAFTWIGTADMANYTIQSDVMTEGQTRKVGGKTKIGKMSEVGLLCHRYVIVLKGTSQQLQVNSNLERVQHTVDFAWEPKVWYVLKARVDIDEKTGAGTVRAKAWKKGDPEPEKWTLEFEHKTAHKQGAPGIFAFTPTDMPVYVDNISIVPTAK